MRRSLVPSALVGLLLAWSATAARADSLYYAHNLVSDQPGVADHYDPNLVNAWGIAGKDGGPFWVSSNEKNLAQIYTGTGASFGGVAVPGEGVTGQVFNPSSTAFGGNHFVFVSEDGTISAWKSGGSATTEVPGSGDNVYKGVAIAQSGGQSFLYAANFRAGAIDVFDTNFSKTALAGNFTDPNGLPTGYAPFNIQNLNGTLFVTYALQDADKHDDVPGPGHGFVDAYNTDGTFLARVATGDASKDLLNSPWGLVIAPGGFGSFSHDLLVGNFGDGTIDAFDPKTFAFLGPLPGLGGKPLSIDGLWGLKVGTGGLGGDPDRIYFAAGPDGESHGLFGSLQPVPEPSTAVTGLLALACAGGYRLARARWRPRQTPSA